MKEIKMEWCNWDDICDFVPDDQFIVGTYVDDNGNATEDASYNTLGLKLKINGKERLAKEREYLVKGNSGKCFIVGEKMFLLNKKLKKVNDKR